MTNFSNTFLINKHFLSCFEDREKNQKEKTNSTVIIDIVPGAPGVPEWEIANPGFTRIVMQWIVSTLISLINVEVGIIVEGVQNLPNH